MAAVARAVEAALVAAFSAANAALGPSDPNRVSVYRTVIPGVPTNRYCVIYAADPTEQNSTMDGLSRDGVGRFQVTCAGTGPDASVADDLCDWMAVKVKRALVDQTLTVDGWMPFVVQMDPVTTWPVAVEVVPGRDTVEIALQFTYLTDRIL